MPALDSVGTTEHMTPAQLEFFGKLFLAENRTYQLVPWFMGIWLDTLLLGLMLVLYAQWQAGSAKTDQKWSKVTVYYLVIMHICLSGLLLAWLFYMFGSGFGQYGMMLNVKWTQATYAVSALCRFPCSLFYTYRAWVMYRRHWAIPVAICPLIAAAVACGLAVAATYRYMPLGKTPKTFIWVMMLLEIIVDVTLSLLLVVGLSRSKTGFKQTDRLIKRVLQLTVETQLPPTLSSALFLVITIKLGMTTQAAWFIAKPKLYPICLFIVLISRKHLARQHRIGEAYVHDSFALASTAGSMMTSDSIKQIRVDTVTHTAVTQQDMAFDKRQQKRINRIPVAPISPSARSDPSDISIKE